MYIVHTLAIPLQQLAKIEAKFNHKNNCIKHQSFLSPQLTLAIKNGAMVLASKELIIPSFVTKSIELTSKVAALFISRFSPSSPTMSPTQETTEGYES